MGTPDFAVPALEAIHGSRHRICAVVTVPDKPQGRGQRLQGSAVKHTAQALELPILQPESLKDPEFRSRLEAYQADVFVVVAFRILPENIFSMPRIGTFNLHASLLPKFRGAAPIHWALLTGEKETGLTTFFLQKSVDTGNIIKQRRTPIHAEDNLESLYQRLKEMGAELCLETLEMLAAGPVHAQEQDDTLASPAPKVGPREMQIDFSEPARVCANRIRAFAPRPGAFTWRQGKRLKVLQANAVLGGGQPGTVIQADHRLLIACGDGALELLELQPESKKAMLVSDYLRGHPCQVGEKLG